MCRKWGSDGQQISNNVSISGTARRICQKYHEITDHPLWVAHFDPATSFWRFFPVFEKWQAALSSEKLSFEVIQPEIGVPYRIDTISLFIIVYLCLSCILSKALKLSFGNSFDWDSEGSVPECRLWSRAGP